MSRPEGREAGGVALAEVPPAVGVDLGGTNIRAAVVRADGSLQAAARARVGDDHAPQAVVSRVCRVIEDALEQASVELGQVSGVGIGVAAQLHGDTGLVAVGPNLGWRQVPFGQMMASALGRSVRVFNDLEAITWAECTHGAARSHQNVLVVFGGTGVGAGLVMDGRLIQGATGVAAEIGHVKVQWPGESCGCGSTGCLEAYLGGANLGRRLQREASEDWPALLRKAGGDPGAIHPGLVEALVAEGDPRAEDLFRELAGMLGVVLANAITLLNPSALVLGGRVLEGCPTLRLWSEAVLSERVLAVSAEALEILSPQLGNQAGMIGAASLVMGSTG